MPTPEQTPPKETQPAASPSSNAAPEPEEWFEDALLGALKAHNQKPLAK